MLKTYVNMSQEDPRRLRKSFDRLLRLSIDGALKK